MLLLVMLCMLFPDKLTSYAGVAIAIFLWTYYWCTYDDVHRYRLDVYLGVRSVLAVSEMYGTYGEETDLFIHTHSHSFFFLTSSRFGTWSDVLILVCHCVVLWAESRSVMMVGDCMACSAEETIFQVQVCCCRDVGPPSFWRGVCEEPYWDELVIHAP